MKFKLLGPLIALLFLTHKTNSARILGVFATPSISHQVVYQPFWKELSRNHEVVVLTTDPLQDESLTNLTEISWKESYKYMDTFKKAVSSPKGFFEMIKIFFKLEEELADYQLNHPDVQKLRANETEHFDLVIIEWILPVHLGFSERFKCPMIGIMSLGADINRYDALGNPSHPVYNPDMQLPYSPPLSLHERVISVIYSVLMRLFYQYGYLPGGNALVTKHFGEGMPSIYEMERKASLLFLNINPMFSVLRPNFPAVIEFNGLHIKAKQPLPEDIQSYLDDAKEGAIYFSLGSNVQSAGLDTEKMQTIIDALAELPYQVLWKWEKEDFPNKPKNIKINKWLPQQDILGHKNVKLFVTQGGLQSLEEAIYNDVPMVGMPFIGDQPYNVKQIVRHGMGKKLDFDTMTKDEFKEVINEVITNPIYKEKVKSIHKLIMDKPMSSLEKLVWWTEYVLRHKGAAHLRSPAIDIPWYQYLLLDVFAVIFIILFITYKLTKFILRKSISIIRSYFKSKDRDVTIVKKNL